MNVFDGVVTVASLVEMVIALLPMVSSSFGGTLSVLRAFRLMRVFRLAKKWKSLNHIITTLLASVVSVAYLCLLLLLFMFMCALLGMQMFGYKFATCPLEGSEQMCPPGLDVFDDCPAHFDCFLPCLPSEAGSWITVIGSPYNDLALCEQFPRNSPVTNGTVYLAQVGRADNPFAVFDNVLQAMVTVFQLLTFDDWTNVLTSAMAATSPWACLYFIGVIVVGNYMVLNLFLAILLDNFASIHDIADEDIDDGEGGDGGQGAPGFLSRQNSVQSIAPAVAPWQVMPLNNDDSSRINTPEVGVGVHRSALSHFGGPEKVAHFSGVSHSGAMSQFGDDEHQPVRRALSHFGTASQFGGEGRRLERPLTAKSRYANGMSHSGAAMSHFGDDLRPASRALSHFGGEKRPMTAMSRYGERSHFGGAPSHFDEDERPMSRMSHFGGDRPVSAYGGKARPTSAYGGRSRPTSAFGGRSGMSMSGASHFGDPSHSGVNTRFKSLMAPTLPSSHFHQLLGQIQQEARTSRDDVTSDDGSSTVDSTMLRAELLTLRRKSVSAMHHMPKHEKEAMIHRMLHGKSLFIFDRRNWIRQRCTQLITHKYFDNFILGVILLSSIALAVDSPNLNSSSVLAQILNVADYVFTSIFVVEASFKVVALGFLFNGPHSYLRSVWNVLDFIIVIISVLCLVLEHVIASSGQLMGLRALRALRALRPLRMANRNEGLRLVVEALLQTFKALGNVLLVCSLFYYIFGVLGVNLLMGKLYSCQDLNGNILDPYYYVPYGNINKTWCEATPVVTTSNYHYNLNVTFPTPYNLTGISWVNNMMNFDYIYTASWTLFQMATLETWSSLMYLCASTTGIDRQPLRLATPALQIFFIFFIIVGSYFVLNLIIGVAIDKFLELSERRGGRSILLTPEQESWRTWQKLLVTTNLETRYLPPVQPWRKPVFMFANSFIFDYFILACIALNVGFMALVHANASEAFTDMLSYANLAFTAIFLMEAIVKIIGFGPKQYFKNSWNLFDFGLVVISIVSVILDFATTQSLGWLPLFRVLRVIRLLRLVMRFKGLRMLLTTLFYSLPALLNVGSVLFLFLFIYAVVGMNLFGLMVLGENMNNHANFANFGISLLTLYRMMTGENWNAIMQDAMATHNCVQLKQDFVYNGTVIPGTFSSNPPTYYTPGDPLLQPIPDDLMVNQCTPAPIVAVIYFCTFVAVGNVMLINLIIAVILDNLKSISHNEDMEVGQGNILQFVNTWAELDPNATNFIPAVKLSQLLMSLDPPLGVRGEDRIASKAQDIIMEVDIPYRTGRVHFVETLHALSGRVLGAELPEQEEFMVHERLVTRLPKDEEPPKFTAAQFFAALHVQAAIRGFLARHKIMMKVRSGNSSHYNFSTRGPASSLRQGSYDIYNQASISNGGRRLGTSNGVGSHHHFNSIGNHNNPFDSFHGRSPYDNSFTTRNVLEGMNGRGIFSSQDNPLQTRTSKPHPVDEEDEGSESDNPGYSLTKSELEQAVDSGVQHDVQASSLSQDRVRWRDNPVSIDEAEEAKVLRAVGDINLGDVPLRDQRFGRPLPIRSAAGAHTDDDDDDDGNGGDDAKVAQQLMAMGVVAPDVPGQISPTTSPSPRVPSQSSVSHHEGGSPLASLVREKSSNLEEEYRPSRAASLSKPGSPGGGLRPLGARVRSPAEARGASFSGNDMAPSTSKRPSPSPSIDTHTSKPSSPSPSIDARTSKPSSPSLSIGTRASSSSKPSSPNQIEGRGGVGSLPSGIGVVNTSLNSSGGRTRSPKGLRAASPASVGVATSSAVRMRSDSAWAGAIPNELASINGENDQHAKGPSGDQEPN